ncbi:hypothetical protein AB0L59_18110 [Streptomyces sp. NPDC052109]|uniref:hypothetical protein n=1 Tax=Streptomyces sp. NPDC052109 TaxID=3155527 RepID=UPI0034231974
MAEHGGVAGPAGGIRRSRLSDYADVTSPQNTPPPAASSSNTPSLPEQSLSFTPATAPAALSEADEVRRRRREFAILLGRFRRTPVLVPVDEEDAPLVADLGGIRWILAFSNEAALARYAVARGEGDREWPYQRWLGARLLDAAVPAVGAPCGVALDAGSEDEGVLFPPVAGIVPDAAAVDIDSGTGDVQ